ncbi:hypothetical protein B0T13DRAFT_500081 [Neurospora crassa]|nr:hypothetical protein B0T13DRAFT_500081 [Neurospora crassa]
MLLAPQKVRSAPFKLVWKAKSAQKDNLKTAMEAQRPSEAQIEPTQTVRQPSSELDAEPSLRSCLRNAAAFIDKRLPGLFSLLSHGKKRLPMEARVVNESIAQKSMTIEDELEKQMVDLHKLVLNKRQY